MRALALLLVIAAPAAAQTTTTTTTNLNPDAWADWTPAADLGAAYSRRSYAIVRYVTTGRQQHTQSMIDGLLDRWVQASGAEPADWTAAAGTAQEQYERQILAAVNVASIPTALD